MALNKYMHHRNIYKNPPDFKYLAKTYPEFSNIANVDVTGKVSIDFKDLKSLRVLTKCLLLEDFKLDVVIPEDRLVPTLPLRLNYILWVEDLLNSIKRTENVFGIDIGTGACAIYPLLAAVKYKWNMVATESDQESLVKAQENIQRNKLDSFIQLKQNSTTSAIEHLFAEENNQIFDFCMCNPPFYSNVQELCESRSIARPPPKNAFTGSPQELITEGGELEFIRKMIAESKKLKDKIRIYTTMVGHKYNLKELLEDLKTDNIKFTHTEFCQGRVTRWGLAWTCQDYNLYELVPPRVKERKKSSPIIYPIPCHEGVANDIDNISKKVISLLDELNIEHKTINKKGNNVVLEIEAKENTWSNQRRKRRLLKRMGAEETKKVKISDIGSSSSSSLIELKETVKNEIESSLQLNAAIVQKGEVVCKPFDGNREFKTGSTNFQPIVHAHIKIIQTNDILVLELEFLKGLGGKEGLHQIVQYIKNNWK